MEKVAATLTVLMLLSACAAGAAGAKNSHAKSFDAVMMEKVRTKAAFDFACPAEQLMVTRIDNRAYGAVGCGKRASYVGRDSEVCWPGNSEENLREYCQVVPDTCIQEQ